LAYLREIPWAQFTVRYAYANVPDPPSAFDWTITEALVTDNPLLESFELVELNGRPAFGYHDRTNQAIYAMLANVAEPLDSSDWTTSMVSSYSPDVADNRPSISLTEVNGRPAALSQCTANGLLFAVADREIPSSMSHWNSHQVWYQVANAQSMAQTSEGLLICCIEGQGDYVQSWLASTPEPTCRRDWRLFCWDPMGHGTNEVPQAVASPGGTPMIFYINFSQFTLNCMRFGGIM
jgi:hypothetical protein